MKSQKRRTKTPPTEPGTKPTTQGHYTGGLPVIQPLTPEQQAFLETLLREHSSWMLAVAFRKGVREPDIPVVNTLIKVVLKFDPDRGGLRRFLWWVLTAELNSAYRDQAKRANRTEALDGTACDTPDEKIARQQYLHEVAEELATAFRTLPLEDQLLLTLHYHDGLTLEEIAQLG